MKVLKVEISADLMCPRCKTVMVRDANRKVFCGHKGCEMYGKKYHPPTVTLREV